MSLAYWICVYVGLGSTSVMWSTMTEAGLLHISEQGSKCGNGSSASCQPQGRWGNKDSLRQSHKLQELLQGQKKVIMRPRGPEGPKRGPYYDPHIGFEPYWANGEWVYKWLHDLLKKNETKGLCEEVCSSMFKDYGVICGRNKRFETKTFDSYCAMLRFDCDEEDVWVIAHRGICQPDIKLYPTMPSSTSSPIPMQSMATYYIESFKKRHPYA